MADVDALLYYDRVNITLFVLEHSSCASVRACVRAGGRTGGRAGGINISFPWSLRSTCHES